MPQWYHVRKGASGFSTHKKRAGVAAGSLYSGRTTPLGLLVLFGAFRLRDLLLSLEFGQDCQSTVVILRAKIRTQDGVFFDDTVVPPGHRHGFYLGVRTASE